MQIPCWLEWSERVCVCVRALRAERPEIGEYVVKAVHYFVCRCRPFGVRLIGFRPPPIHGKQTMRPHSLSVLIGWWAALLGVHAFRIRMQIDNNNDNNINNVFLWISSDLFGLYTQAHWLFFRIRHHSTQSIKKTITSILCPAPLPLCFNRCAGQLVATIRI